MRDKWTRDEVIYHIYPLSFQDSDGDGYGDIRGIISRIDHLGGKPGSLGVDAIWLSPVFPSPLVDYGYDVADYTAIGPLFGDLAAFDELVASAHDRGIKVMLDFVLNHTSEAHPWFQASRSSRQDPKRDWYLWKDPAPGGGPPNNWIGVFGGSAWTLDERTGQYYLHSFLPEQPDLNWRHPEVAKAMEEVMRFWMRRGVDGFRLDAVYHVIKDAEFRDEPPNPAYRPGLDDPYKALAHVHSQRQPGTFEVIRRLSAVAAEGGAFMVGEAYIDIDEMRKFFVHCDRRRYAPLNFNLMNLPWDAREYRRYLAAYLAALPEDAAPNMVLGNHDRPRLATRLDPARARTSAVLLLTLPGMAFIYYGDEIGMRDIAIPPEKERDPFGKRVGLPLGRDPQRSPMQWGPGAHAGFTTGEPWLPVHPDSAQVNVEAASRDPRSLLSLYRGLLRLRKEFATLRRGSWKGLDAGPDVLAYLRTDGETTVIVLANFAGEPRAAGLDWAAPLKTLIDSGLTRERGSVVDPAALVLGPYEAVVLKA